MENRKSLIVTGIVILIILLLVGAVIYYLIQFIRNRQQPRTGDQLFPQATLIPSPTGVVTGGVATPAPTPQQPVIGGWPQQSNIQTFNGQGFALQYPSNWGLLTCSNSPNFEFDPNSNIDQTVVCDRALKPITIQRTFTTGCQGGTQVNLGGLPVTKLVDASGGTTDYKWCVNGPVYLEFTHRVSPAPPNSAYSVQDSSSQVEEVIKSLRFGTSS